MFKVSIMRVFLGNIEKKIKKMKKEDKKNVRKKEEEYS